MTELIKYKKNWPDYFGFFDCVLCFLLKKTISYKRWTAITKKRSVDISLRTSNDSDESPTGEDTDKE